MYVYVHVQVYICMGLFIYVCVVTDTFCIFTCFFAQLTISWFDNRARILSHV